MDLSNIGGIVSIPLGLVSILALALILERLTFWVTILSTQTVVKDNLLTDFRHSSAKERTLARIL